MVSYGTDFLLRRLTLHDVEMGESGALDISYRRRKEGIGHGYTGGRRLLAAPRFLWPRGATVRKFLSWTGYLLAAVVLAGFITMTVCYSVRG